LGKPSNLTDLFVYLIPRRLIALSHSEMAFGYGKDSTPNAELLNPCAQHVKCSSSTDPGTITITNSATSIHSPNLSRVPKRVASPHNSLAERGAGGVCVGVCWFWLLIRLIAALAAAGFAPSAAAAAASRLLCRAALSVMGGGGGEALVEEGGQAVKKRLRSIALLWYALFQKSLAPVCGPKICCFFKLAAVADNGLLSALEGGWAPRCCPWATK